MRSLLLAPRSRPALSATTTAAAHLGEATAAPRVPRIARGSYSNHGPEGVAGFSYHDIARITGGRTYTNVNKHLVTARA